MAKKRKKTKEPAPTPRLVGPEQGPTAGEPEREPAWQDPPEPGRADEPTSAPETVAEADGPAEGAAPGPGPGLELPPALRTGAPGRAGRGDLLSGLTRRLPSPSFLAHVQPRLVLARSLEPGRSLGLGLLSLFMAAVLVVTGVLLMVYYVPSVAGAYGSIQDLHAVVPFGGLTRNVHRWAGHAMVVLVALHMLRTLLTGSYKAGRHGVWTSGLWLLVLTLAFAFTGYLLPWDQLSYWAVSIGGHLARNVPLLGPALGRALLGGEEVGEATLVRFYALHVGVLPLVTTLLVTVHLYRLRRAGGLAGPRVGGRVERLPAWPHLYERELALLGLALAALVVAGVLFDAPLAVEPDLEHPDNPARAPWYFLGLQELVSYSSFVGGVLAPALLLLGAYLVPRLDPGEDGAGEWLAPRGGATAFAAGALVAGAVLPLGLWLHENGSAPAAMHPATLLLASGAATSIAIGALGRSPRLAVLAATGSAAVATAALTGVGLWLRGASWALLWPFGGSP